MGVGTWLLASWIVLHQFRSLPCEVAETEITQTLSEQEQLHLVLHRSAKVNVTASKSTEPDESTVTTLHIHLQSTRSVYLQKPCSIRHGNDPPGNASTLGEVCRNEVSQIWQDWSTVQWLISQKTVEDLQHYASIVCPSSTAWVAFVQCYCSKCDPQSIEIPDEEAWTAVWSKLPFCQSALHEGNRNLCEWTFFTKASESRAKHIDGMFRSAWNEEMETQKSVVTEVVEHEVEIRRVHKIKIAADTANKSGESEYKEQESEKKEKDEEEEEESNDRRLLDTTNISSTSFLSVHSLVYLWTIVLATCVTILSFFILVR